MSPIARSTASYTRKIRSRPVGTWFLSTPGNASGSKYFQLKWQAMSTPRK